MLCVNSIQKQASMSRRFTFEVFLSIFNVIMLVAVEVGLDSFSLSVPKSSRTFSRL